MDLVYLAIFLLLAFTVIHYNHNHTTEHFIQNLHTNCYGSKECNKRKFPTYSRPCASLLDAVPPPDPHHEFRCPGFSHQPTGINDFDRWNTVWSPHRKDLKSIQY